MTPLDRLIRLCGRCGAALSFAAALAVYLLTVEPGASYWDCPEYVVTATAMEVGHPPGNPVWTLAMRMATILAPAGMEALAINICSGIFTALAAALLYLVIFAAWRRLFSAATRATTITGALASLGGALAFAWCDSVWFSAVEAEVYAMSIFLTVLMLWLMTIWTRCPDSGRGDRLLVLTAYITGLSLGVHQSPCPPRARLDVGICPVSGHDPAWNRIAQGGARCGPVLCRDSLCPRSPYARTARRSRRHGGFSLSIPSHCHITPAY